MFFNKRVLNLYFAKAGGVFLKKNYENVLI